MQPIAITRAITELIQKFPHLQLLLVEAQAELEEGLVEQ